MAYFPNGTSGMMYEEQYCDRCHHLPEKPEDGGCSVWLLHLLHNYEPDKRPLLDVLIPEKDGHPVQCTMFVDRAKVRT